jgi:hypothetical protein
LANAGEIIGSLEVLPFELCLPHVRGGGQSCTFGRKKMGEIETRETHFIGEKSL